MTTIRPPATPPAQLNQARAAFFRPTAPQAAAVAGQTPTALQPAATPAPTAKAPQPAPERPLRPGSIIDIRV